MNHGNHGSLSLFFAAFMGAVVAGQCQMAARAPRGPQAPVAPEVEVETAECEAAPAPVAPAWAATACARICRSRGGLSVVQPSTRPEDGGWRCLCDFTEPQE